MIRDFRWRAIVPAWRGPGRRTARPIRGQHYKGVMINRTQALVLGFSVAEWVSLVGILVAAPDVFAGALKLPGGGSRAPELAFLVAISGFLALLGASMWPTGRPQGADPAARLAGRVAGHPRGCCGSRGSRRRRLRPGQAGRMLRCGAACGHHPSARPDSSTPCRGGWAMSTATSIEWTELLCTTTGRFRGRLRSIIFWPAGVDSRPADVSSVRLAPSWTSRPGGCRARSRRPVQANRR